MAVLFVCTANICRSPMAERLVSAMLAGRLGVQADQITVSSAGVVAREGEPMNPVAAAALRGRGIDAGGFGARLLRPEHIVGSTLVLAAAREHRSAVARLVPRAAARCFTVREFDRYSTVVDITALPAHGPAPRLAALVDQVAGLRGSLSPVAPAADDVADPYLLGESVMQSCAAQLAAASQRWVEIVARTG